MKKLTILPALVAAAAMLGIARADETFRKDARPPADITKDRTLYVIGYAHLDTQWRWSYQETIDRFILNTLQDNFSLFDKYPNYVFNFSGSRRYEMMREYYPALYGKLKGYIAQGRWFPCGSSVDEGDAIVPSGEAMIRHVLYGNRYFKAEFGKESAEFMLPDCFGFPASLPTLLAHCGIKGFSTQKLTWGSAVGIPFKVGVWNGPDGNGVVAALDPGSYGAVIEEDVQKSETWLHRIEETGTRSGAFVDYHYYGTGDRGGAPSEKSVLRLEHSLATAGPVRVVSSQADEMFKALKPGQIAKLPTYKGELLLTQHSAGSITSQAYMKRWNRKNELLADAAERASVVAAWLGGAPYPAQKLFDAWDLFLGSQMHDMLPGTSIPKAYEFCWNDDLLALNRFAAVTTDAVGSVAAAMDTQGKGGISLVVYNPLAIDRSDLAEATVTFSGTAPAALEAVGLNGAKTPVQILSREGNRATVLFSARVPSVGFAVYNIVEAALATGGTDSQLGISDGSLENERYKVTLNAEGDIASVYDKPNQRELLAAPARLAFQYENPSQYPAWNMDWADRQKPPRAYVGGPATLRVIERGPVRVALEVTRESEGSRFVQRIRLWPGGDFVEVSNTIDWKTKESSLKAAFPFGVSNPLAAYDDKVGVLERDNNNAKRYEAPQHHWFDLTDKSGAYGVAVLNESKFGSDKPDDHTMRLTLLYTPGTRAGYPDQGTQDFGRHDIGYAIAGHTGGWREGGVVWQANRFNQPLATFQSAQHEGALGRRFSLLKTGADHIAVVALKKAEDGDEIIVRLQEMSGTAGATRVAFTVPVVSAREVNGQEKAVGNARINGGELLAELPAFGLRSFAVKLAAPAKRTSPPKSQAVALDYNLDAVSADAATTDGDFDGQGRTYPAEPFPSSLTAAGVEFKLGPTAPGKANALVCKGQTIELPAGKFNRVYVLAAAADGDAHGTFAVGSAHQEQTVRDWSGYIGQWDKRLWKGGPKGPYGYNQSDIMAGLVPGYVHTDTVAWTCSHRHAKTGNTFYEYCYLFQYGFDIPAGAHTLTLPANDKIRVFAISVAETDHDAVTPAHPLYDTLADHTLAAPRFSPAPGAYRDATFVAIDALYSREGLLHYTLDGSEPTAASPVYEEPVAVAGNVTVKARIVYPEGAMSETVSAQYDVNDTTAPAVKKAFAFLNQAVVEFSEPLDASAGDVSHYQFEPSRVVRSARLDARRMRVLLALAEPVGEDALKLTLSGIADTAKPANVIKQTVSVVCQHPVYSNAGGVFDGKTTKTETVNTAMPVKPADPWTVNFFVRMDRQPENRTVIAGFGKAVDRPGMGRYLCNFANGIHFWAASRDGETHTRYDIGKWQMVTAAFDGNRVTIFKNGREIGNCDLGSGPGLSADEPVVRLAPVDPWDHQRRFAGEIRDFTLWPEALSETALRELLKRMPK